MVQAPNILSKILSDTQHQKQTVNNFENKSKSIIVFAMFCMTFSDLKTHDPFSC